MVNLLFIIDKGCFIQIKSFRMFDNLKSEENNNQSKVFFRCSCMLKNIHSKPIVNKLWPYEIWGDLKTLQY